MKNLYTVALTLAVVIGLVSMASAQERINRREAARIQRDRAETRHDIRRATADGVVTPRERAEIRQDIRRTNREIYRDTHNYNGRRGEITRGEAARIRRDQAETRRDIYRAKRDGVITPRERAEIHHDIKRTRKEIYRDTHNEKRRY